VQDPDLVRAIVELNPFTKKQTVSLGAFLRVRRYRRGGTRLIGTQVFKSLRQWLRYLDVAYPTKPADYDAYMAAMAAKLREPGRMAEFMKTSKSKPAETGARLPDVRCPALVIMGTLDPDFADPRAEGEAVVAAMPAGIGTVAMIGGAGHYPHAQSPDEVTALVIPFLKEHARA
jgi:pimeloyl-ACP methyl ester carboxylesterase